MAELTFEITPHPDTVIVRVAGDAGVAESGDLERHLNRFVAGQPAFAVMDLSGLAFISSLTLGMLVQAHRAIQRRHGRLVLAAPQPQVLAVIRRCKLEEVFEIRETVDDALAARG